MQRVTKFSRREIKDLLKAKDLSKPFVLISINDTEREAKEILELAEGTAVLDVVSIVHPDDCHTSFTQHCPAILELLDSVYSTDINVYVHCWAGISRSAAVAKFAEEVLEVERPKLLNYKIHNNVIYNTLQRENFML